MSIRDLRFHSRTVNRIGDANAGTNRNGMIVLNHSHEGPPARDVGQPIIEETAEKMGIVVVDRYGRRARRHVSREHIGGSRPETFHGRVGRKEAKKLVVLNW
jgi:hypothetical protein